MADLTSQIKEDDPRGELVPPLKLPTAEQVLEGQGNVEDSESPTRTTQKTFLERMQDSLAQPGVAPLAPLGQALYMKDPEIPPFKADLPPEKDVGGFYGTPSEDAAKFSVGDKDVVFYDKTRGAPAIFGEPTQKFEPIFGKEIFGIDIKTEQFFSRGTDTIDYSKLNPIVKIEDVIDTSNPEEFARINNETGFIDDKGNFYESVSYTHLTLPTTTYV